jgi:hypothetical protein
MAHYVSPLKCKKCSPCAPRFAPNLVQSGYASPFDGKCPICDTIHSLKTGEAKEDTRRMHWFRSSGVNWQNQQKIDSFY